MDNLEIMNKSEDHICYKCSGKGAYPSRKDKKIEEVCSICNGTGKFTENFYYLIDKQNKIAFGVDHVGK